MSVWKIRIDARWREYTSR